ncbi:hypothetical protein E5U26_08145 [Burkholderia pseudomallei]|nr:hypothetical protein [Burkholderia pseudomallei]
MATPMSFSRTGRRDFTPRNGAARGESRAAAGAVGAPGSARAHASVGADRRLVSDSRRSTTM